MNTVERLQQYYPFEQTVIDHVAETAEAQASFSTYRDFFNAVGISEPQTFTTENNTNRSIIDIRPVEHDPAQALVMHLPMANPLDTNQLYQLGTIAYAMPDMRIIAMGNPSGGVFNDGTLGRSHRKQVSKGNFTPVIDPLAEYLDNAGVDYVVNVGGSYGAELAAAFAAKGSQQVKNTVYFEPASVVGRSLIRLGADFKSSEPAMQDYVEANGLTTFIDARKDAVSARDYITGIFRLTNIAIARGLARGAFELNANAALLAQEGMLTNFAWGSESELAVDAITSQIVQRYTEAAGPKRVPHVMRLLGQKHAAGNDLALTNAIILQSLKA